VYQQGRWQKIFHEGQRIKGPKISKNTENSTICLFRGGQWKKDRKIAKKGRKYPGARNGPPTSLLPTSIGYRYCIHYEQFSHKFYSLKNFA